MASLQTTFHDVFLGPTSDLGQEVRRATPSLMSVMAKSRAAILRLRGALIKQCAGQLRFPTDLCQFVNASQTVQPELLNERRFEERRHRRWAV